MAIFFLFFSVQFGVLSRLEERRDGTLGRILVSPVRPWSVLGGKLLTSLAIGIVSMAVLTVATPTSRSGPTGGTRWAWRC